MKFCSGNNTKRTTVYRYATREWSPYLWHTPSTPIDNPLFEFDTTSLTQTFIGKSSAHRRYSNTHQRRLSDKIPVTHAKHLNNVNGYDTISLQSIQEIIRQDNVRKSNNMITQKLHVHNRKIRGEHFIIKNNIYFLGTHLFN